jgi:hypothetical protein
MTVNELIEKLQALKESEPTVGNWDVFVGKDAATSPDKARDVEMFGPDNTVTVLI